MMADVMTQEIVLSEGGRAFRVELWETREFKSHVEEKKPEKGGSGREVG